MPSGRVRWFDAKKGFGFITNDEGEDVFLPAAALPDGVTTLRKGARVEFSVIDGRKEPQAMGVTLVASVPSLVKATRPKPDDLARHRGGPYQVAGFRGQRAASPSVSLRRRQPELATLLRGVAVLRQCRNEGTRG